MATRTTKKATASPRRAARTTTKTTAKKVVAPRKVELVEEEETSAVSVEEVEETPEDVETEETDEDLEDEETEEYEDEYEEADEDDEDEESISPETVKALAAEMEKEVEVEPVKIRRLTIADIKDAEDITEEPFFVEEWDGEVLLRSPSARKLIRMIKESGQGQLSVDGSGQAQTSDVDFDVMLGELIKMAVIDPPIDDAAYEVILDKSAGAVFGIFGQIQKIAKLDRISSSGKKIDAVKEEEKNFRKG